MNTPTEDGAYYRQGWDGAHTSRAATLCGLVIFLLLYLACAFLLGLPVAIIGETLGLKGQPYFGGPLLLTVLIVPAGFGSAVIAAWITVRRWHGRSGRSLFTAAGAFEWSRVLQGFAIWLGIDLVLTGATVALEGPGELVWVFEPVRFFAWLPVIMLVVFIQTASEEIAFRGYLLQSAARLMPFGIAAFVVVVLFGAAHSQYGWAGKTMTMSVGVLQTALVWYGGGLERAIGLHFAHNLFSFLLVNRPNAPLQAPSLFRGPAADPDLLDLLLQLVQIALFLLIDAAWTRRRRVRAATPQLA